MNKKNNTTTAKTYLEQSTFKTWTLRAPWLLILMLSTTFTSLILSGYEQKLSAMESGAILYAFVPMLMGTAGNAGGQSSVTVIRALALEEITLKNAFQIVFKEIIVGFFLGVTVGVACFLKLFFIDSIYIEGISVHVALIIASVLALTIIVAKSVGCTLPLIVKKLGLDPAVVASPFMTTVVDVLTLIIYCSISIAFL